MKEEMLKTAAILETAYNAKVPAKAGDEQRCGPEGVGEGDAQRCGQEGVGEGDAQRCGQEGVGERGRAALRTRRCRRRRQAG
jgi:hypothetical protein